MSVTDPIVTFVPILVIGIVAGILFDRLLVRPDSPLLTASWPARVRPPRLEIKTASI